MKKAYPENEQIKPFMFYREGGFYIIEIPPSTVEENVKLNEGTIKVECAIAGKIVWPKF